MTKTIVNNTNNILEGYQVKATQALDTLPFQEVNETTFSTNVVLSVGDFILADDIVVRIKSARYDYIDGHHYTIAEANEDLSESITINEWFMFPNIETNFLDGKATFTSTNDKYDVIRKFSYKIDTQTVDKNIIGTIVNSFTTSPENMLEIGDIVILNSLHFAKIVTRTTDTNLNLVHTFILLDTELVERDNQDIIVTDVRFVIIPTNTVTYFDIELNTNVILNTTFSSASYTSNSVSFDYDTVINTTTNYIECVSQGYRFTLTQIEKIVGVQ